MAEARLAAEVVRRPEGLRAAAPGWDRLAASFGSPLLAYDWFISCVEAIHGADALRAVVVRRGGEVAAVAPLVLSEKGGRMEFSGVSTLYEPCGLLYDDALSLKALLAAMARTGHPSVLLRLPSDASEEILRHAWSSGVCVRSESPCTRFVRAGSSWEGYIGGLSQKRRYDLRRARKRAGQMGKVSARVFCPEPAELDECLEAVYAVEASGWKGRRGSAILSKRKLRDFFDAYAARACREGILRLCLLDIGGKTAAAQIAVEYGRRLWVLKIGYDEGFSRCSPGVVLTMEAMRYAFSRGLEAYEFLGTDEPWLDLWEAERRSHANCYIYPFSAAGFLGLAADAPRLLFRGLASAGLEGGSSGVRPLPKP